MKATANGFPRKKEVRGASITSELPLVRWWLLRLVVWAILTYNWQSAFVITGAMGLLWVGLWLLLYRSPDEHPALLGLRKNLH